MKTFFFVFALLSAPAFASGRNPYSSLDTERVYDKLALEFVQPEALKVAVGDLGEGITLVGRCASKNYMQSTHFGAPKHNRTVNIGVMTAEKLKLSFRTDPLQKSYLHFEFYSEPNPDHFEDDSEVTVAATTITVPVSGKMAWVEFDRQHKPDADPDRVSAPHETYVLKKIAGSAPYWIAQRKWDNTANIYERTQLYGTHLRNQIVTRNETFCYYSSAPTKENP